MKPKLDVVIIATIRAELLHMTLSSFTDKLLHQFDCRAIINVDPVGETDRNTQTDIVNICRAYFPEVVFTCPPKPSFAKAVKTAWTQVQTDLFFHLEDDWILRYEIPAQDLLAPMQNPDVVSVFLNKRGEVATRMLGEVKYYNPFWQLYTSPSLNPGLFKTKYAQALAVRMNVQKDPEFQFISDHHTAEFPAPKFLRQISVEPYVIDTGALWRKTQGLKKHNGEGVKTHWKKQDQHYESALNRILLKLRYANRRRRYYFAKRAWQRQYCPTDRWKNRK